MVPVTILRPDVLDEVERFIFIISHLPHCQPIAGDARRRIKSDFTL
jgi:hypothetical protein